MNRNKLRASPEEIRAAMERLGAAQAPPSDPVRVDHKGRLVFFPFWPLGRRGYLVPDQATAATLRERIRRRVWWSKLIPWAPIPLWSVFYGFGLRPAWFLVFLGCYVVLGLAAGLSWHRRIVGDLERAPASEMFSYRRRLTDHAAATGLPFKMFGIGVACLIAAGSLLLLKLPFGRGWTTAPYSDFGGLPRWAAVLIYRAAGLAGLVFSSLLIAAILYQFWFLMTHREEVRLRRRAARLWE